ncbi:MULTISPECIES: LptF/LptG family permease [unclassified Mucilaginibacter]|uniref:LptF/LptG family permease n=1 Tax=unclassified Mucilaginibacter TaxID=2617802 RepID=UPI000962AB3E|nr:MULTISPECIES: LptF/LptG family permease [unclassified Mucilaginibacter]OJW14841.1 MAG: permease [Mucilaginibacter sp. 44-25]PLW89495.1 MAG: YjgP/YjgQ family permease [Mucilaginibacter sp.]PMP65480.1 MAG: YjgP/YjgQ family permease [Mucilaginibacter sp.]HEK22222.1 YjgP/YjgQ family permease [Bacteroidota bacterium]
MKKLLRRYLTVIDRFIMGKYLGTFVFTLGIFLVISVIFDISEHLDNFLGKNANLHDIIFKYYAGFIPFYLMLLSPLINFLAVIFFTAKMANQTEIVPILTSRASFYRFLRPYVISASIIFTASLLLNVYVIPYTNKLKVDFESANFFANDDQSKLDVHIQLDKHTYVYLQSFDPAMQTGYQFMMEKFDGDEMKQRLTATSIKYDSLKNHWIINAPTRRYINGLKETWATSSAQLDTVLDMRPIDFQAHDNVVSNIYGAMPLPVLNAAIAKEKIRSTGAVIDMEFEKYRRFVEPLSTFVLTCIGVAISSRKVRGGVGLPLGIGIFICFTYIVVNKFALVFSIKGGFDPLISVFIPNVLFGILGYILIVKAPK